MTKQEIVYVGGTEHSPFVGRGNEIANFIDIVERIGREAPVPSNIFEHYGPPGMGKSALLKEQSRIVVDRGGYTSYIDFKENGPERNSVYENNPMILLNDIRKQLGTMSNRDNKFIDFKSFDQEMNKFMQVSLPKKGIIAAYNKLNQEARLYQRPKWLNDVRAITIEFIKAINTSDPTLMKALFVDHMDNASIEMLNWMEEWIINPILQISSVYIGCGVRAPWRWKRPEIRRRLTSDKPLAGLDHTAIAGLMNKKWTYPDKIKSEDVDSVYQLTGGLPGAITVLKDNKKPTSKIIYDQFLKPEVIASLPKQLVATFLPMCCVRLFDTSMLHAIISAASGESQEKDNNRDWGKLVLDWKKTSLIVWDKGSAIEPHIRKLGRNYLKDNYPENFTSVNEAALSVYDSWLSRPIDSRAIMTVEELYHMGILGYENRKILSNFQRRLTQFDTKIADTLARSYQVEKLWEMMACDDELHLIVPAILAAFNIKHKPK